MLFETLILLIPEVVMAVGVAWGLFKVQERLAEQLELPADMVQEEGIEVRVPDIAAQGGVLQG